MIVFVYIEQYILFIKENMICQDFNGRFNYKIKFEFNQKIYIKIMRCKIVRFQKLMCRNIMRSTKSQKSFGFILQYRFCPFKKSSWAKFMCKNKFFQSSGMKNELHAMFKNENNSLTYII